MGLIECQTHGRQGLSLASPEIVQALVANPRMSAAGIAQVRYTSVNDDEYPPGRAWFLRERVRPAGDRVLSIDELLTLETEPACGECLNEWLRLNGVDTERSNEERRFLRLHDALAELLRPRLEPRLRALADALFAKTRSPSGWGFRSLTDRPFVPYCESKSEGHIEIELRDCFSRLEGTVRSSILAIPMTAEVATPIRVTLSKGELDQAARAELDRWGDRLERFLSDGLTLLAS